MTPVADEPLVVRARWVLPVDAPPIEYGEVAADPTGQLTYVGPARRSGAPALDCGEAAILPGLVNAHTHLEYTVFRGLLEDRPFFPWVRELTRLKAFLTPDDWVCSAMLGAAEMLAAGVTTVGDCADAGAALDALLTSGLGGVVFREVFGITDDEPVERTVAALDGKVCAMRARVRERGARERVRVGISPHAPYTVRPELFTALAEYARGEGLRQAIHVAESPAETALIERGCGPFAEMFARRGVAWRPPGVSPVHHIADCGGFDAPTLAIHCVHIDGNDAALLAERGVAVAHCPHSNGKLAAGVAPVETLRRAGVRVGLGTDSVASNNAADPFAEMRAAVFAARARSHDAGALTAGGALAMATRDGAATLGLDGETGTLTVGKRADLCVVDLGGPHIFPAGEDDPVAALVYSARAADVRLTVAGGRVLYDRGTFPTLDVGGLRAHGRDVRRRLREAALAGTA